MPDAIPIESSTDQGRDAVAAEVRAELSRQRKTQRDVAVILDLPQASVNRRLNGKTPFRAEEIVALAEALNIPATRLLPPTEVGAA